MSAEGSGVDRPIGPVEPEPEGVPGPPGLPLGRRVELPGRGTTFVREVAGPPGAPTVVLLHGWLASGGLNWFRAFEPLSRHFHVVAPDLRGHGRGIRSRRRFRLGDCADDVAAMCEVLGIGSAVVVGYSLGGPVAQLTWRQHPDLVDGLVLCATSQAIVPVVHQRLMFTTAMAAAAGTTRLSQMMTRLPRSFVKRFWPLETGSGRPGTLQRWAAAEMRRHSWRTLLEAGHASGNYNASRWIGEVDVPTAVLITTKDRALSPLMQARLAFSIPGAAIHRVDEGHMVCASPGFGAPLVTACLDVARQLDSRDADIA
ncbi:MAG: alpha/beta hydrolase [Acidimicrobiia bacterium]|nr:alpha/beta hydrolase [Acidimicrobiia bacterium]